MSNYSCPYCDKKFKMKHLLVNHIRQSSGSHGKKYGFPADYKEKIENLKSIENNKAVEKGLAEAPEIKPDPSTQAQKIEKVIKVDPPEIPITKTSKCPDCGEDKANWINTREAYKHEINLSKEEIGEYDYVCPKCYELIKVN